MKARKKERNQKKPGKKGQAATEFLMTYGWALLVVAAGIGALAYFGVLSPTRFIPETCTISSTAGIACLDFKVTPDMATVLITNGGGRDIHLYNITIGECGTSPDIDFRDGEKHTFNVTGCAYGNMGQKVKADMDLTYSLKESTLIKPVQGRIVAKISP